MLRPLFFALGALFGGQVICFQACEAIDVVTMHRTACSADNPVLWHTVSGWVRPVTRLFVLRQLRFQSSPLCGR